MSFSFGQIWLVTSGACTPSLTSARTVIAMSRLRRHKIGSSWEYSIFAICCSGTATPLRDVLRGEAKRPGAVLIDDELQVGRLLVPIELRLLDVRVLLHDVADLVGDLAHLLGVGTDHAKLHGKADRRAEIEAVDAHARF